MKRTISRRAGLLAIALILATILAGPTAIFAQEPVSSEQPPVLTATMKALLADQQPAWDLSLIHI